MNSRERVALTLEHKEADRVPLDLGGTAVSGMHASSVYLLRQALELDEPGTPVKVIEPYQMLGEIKPDLIEALGVDIVGLGGTRTIFGFENDGWKEWTFCGGTPVLVPEAFNTEPEPNGDVFMYPEGDRSAEPSARMPNGGYYFDSLVRQAPIDDENLNVEDNLEEFVAVSDEELEHFRREAQRLYSRTDKAIVLCPGGTSFGDIALVPAPWLKNPKGIRDVQEWYISTALRRDYVYKVFERQCEIGIENLAKVHRVVGERASVFYSSGTDFGTQSGTFISAQTYRDLYKPFHKAVNDWVHRNTNWKTFIHTCGAVASLLEDFIEAGFDILNPVQCSATGMDPVELKKNVGDRVTFWGGGVDTQRTLPFGTADQVRTEVEDRISIFGKGGGFVFNTVHNVQARTPVENLMALYESVKEHGGYPL